MPAFVGAGDVADAIRAYSFQIGKAARGSAHSIRLRDAVDAFVAFHFDPVCVVDAVLSSHCGAAAPARSILRPVRYRAAVHR